MSDLANYIRHAERQQKIIEKMKAKIGQVEAENAEARVIQEELLSHAQSLEAKVAELTPAPSNVE